MEKIWYCKRCGHTAYKTLIGDIISLVINGHTCNWCGNCSVRMSIMPNKISEEYKCFNHSLSGWSDEWLNEKIRFVNDYLSQYPEFDSDSWKKELEKLEEGTQRHFEIEAEQQTEAQAKLHQQIQRSMEKENCVPKCPSCGSTNVAKISTINRATSVALVGLASNKIGKTHKCNNCGTTW